MTIATRGGFDVIIVIKVRPFNRNYPNSKSAKMTIVKQKDLSNGWNENWISCKALIEVCTWMEEILSPSSECEEVENLVNR